MKDLLIFPFGGNAQESLLAVQSINKYRPVWNVLGFIDDDKSQWGKEFCGVKVLGGRNILGGSIHALVLAVPGNPHNYQKRKQIIDNLGLPDSRFVTIIDTSIRISPDALIGHNTVCMAHSFISCSVTIGSNCVILPNTVIAHNSHIGDYCMIGSNVTISGSCKIGDSCYIGSGSKIKDHIKIGPQSLIGIGSCVIRDVEANSVVVGNPARLLRKTDNSQISKM